MNRENENQTIKKLVMWILIIVWMICIFLFSSQNADESSELSQGFLRSFVLKFLPDNISRNQNTVDFLEHLLRKCAHMTEYTILGVFISVQIRLYKTFRREWQKVLAAVLFVMLYASTDEFHQLFVTGRSAQVTDVMIDTCGGLIGAGLTAAIVAILHGRNKCREGKGGLL